MGKERSQRIGEFSSALDLRKTDLHDSHIFTHHWRLWALVSGQGGSIGTWEKQEPIGKIGGLNYTIKYWMKERPTPSIPKFSVTSGDFGYWSGRLNRVMGKTGADRKNRAGLITQI